jgi:predicted DCC family thiol-disulfide oxidoreductase YuxK
MLPVAVDRNAGLRLTAIDMPAIRVYYNSACPVCNAGISHQRLSHQRRKMAGCAVQWRDVHRDLDARREIPADLEFVRERLHVIDETGRIRSGVDAFEVIWRHSPHEKWKARLIALPLLRPLATLLYNAFARALYKWNRLNKRWQ